MPCDDRTTKLVDQSKVISYQYSSWEIPTGRARSDAQEGVCRLPTTPSRSGTAFSAFLSTS